MTIDFGSPSFLVSVISTQPELRIQGRNDPDALGQVLDQMTDVSERVLSFEYEDDEEKHDVLTLTVDNHDLHFFRHPAWIKGNLVRFRFGYPGRIFGPRVHVIDNFSGFLTLKITCVEQVSMANATKTRTFTNKTRVQVIEELIAEGAFPGVTSLDVEASALAKESARDWTQAGQTDWQFAQRLAEKPGFEVYIEDEVLHFHKRRLAQRPVRRYEYFWGNGDLIDFDIKEWRTTDRPAETAVESRDPTSRQNLSAQGGNASTERPTLGSQGTLVLTSSRDGRLVAGKTVTASPATTQQGVTQEADTRYRRQEEGEIEAEAHIIGDPKLKAKQVIEVVGLERQLSGKYYVRSVKHSIDKGGYVSTLGLLKNALTAMPLSDPPSLDKTKAQENTAATREDRRLRLVADPVTGRLRQE